MLIYSPAYDIHHCIYRAIFILKKLELNDTIEIDRLKIIDFYLVFPSLITEIKFTRNYAGLKKPFNNFITKYRKVTNKFVTFQTMKPLQDQAIDYLCLKGYISYANGGKVSPTPLIRSLNIPIRENYFKGIDIVTEEKLFDFFFETEFYGANGLKARTNLMEFKYDNL